MPINDLIILRKGTETEWINSNPVLVSGEPGYDSTNNILKVGDGDTNWNSLNNIGSTDEQIDDRVASLLVAGSGISLNYNDNTNSLNVSFSGIDLGTYPLITITSQPVNASGYFDETLSFEVSATSTLPVRTLYYQWQKSSDNISFSNISGQNSSTLTFNTSSNSDNGYYRCLLTSDLSFKYSDSASLTVSARPQGSGASYVYEKNLIYSWF
jgi:hypothetical protein